MRRRSPWVVIGIVVLVMVAAAWAGRGVLRRHHPALLAASRTIWPASTTSAAARDVILPFDLVHKKVMLKVRVNGSRPLSFVLDTGDKFAAIDLDRAKELGLSLEGHVAVAGVGSQASAGAFVRDASFSIDGFPGFSQSVTLAIPLKPMARRVGQDFDGILGADFIREFVLELDYQARAITLHDKNAFVYSGPGESLPMRLDAQGHPTIQAEVAPFGDDPFKGTFLLDVGSGSALVLYSPFVAAHHLPGPHLKTVKGLGGAGTGGRAAGQTGRVAKFTVGRWTLESPITFFSEDKAGAYASAATEGSLGQQVLGRFRLFLDYGHDRIIFEPTATVPRPFDVASGGIDLEAEGKDYRTFRITEVLEGAPGSESGLRPDDVIDAIDGRPAAELTLSRLLEMFERPVPYTLTIRRGGRALTVILTPRPLV